MVLAGTSTPTSGNFGGGVSATAPSTQQPGDFLIAVAGANGTPTSWTAPTGWTAGTNSGSASGQQLRWWSEIVPASPSTSYTFSSSSYADGGLVILDFRGVASTNPVQSVSVLTNNDNGGNGNITTPSFAAASWSGTASVVSLLIASWQPNTATVTWPAGFKQLSTASDGYASVVAAANLTSTWATSLVAQTAKTSTTEFAIPTIQVALSVAGSGTPPPTPTPSPSSSPTPTPSSTPTPTPSSTPTPTPSPTPTPTPSTCAGNPIQVENCLTGDPSWGDFATVLDPTAISGYGSTISVNHGGSIDFFVTTTASNVTIDVFRTGWYGGAGARLMQSLGTFPGVNQPQANPDPTYGMVVEKWSKTTTLNIPSSWTTGAYVARLSASSGNKSFIFFVVRNDGGNEPYVFQTSVNTYQAYNTYGGTSLYNNNTNKSIYSPPHAMKVSYDRPFNPGDSNGAGHFLWWEYPMLRWLEKNGYNVTYTTDVDTDSGVNPLTNHKALLVVGHDEYWSKGMRDNVEGAIARGVNVALFAGNESYWQVRYENNAAGTPRRVMVGYKDFASCTCPPGPDPMWGVNNTVVTDLWRSTTVNRPEDSMMGAMFGGEVNNADWTVQNASSWIYAGTGWTNGTRVPGIVGYEYDHYFGDATTPPGTIVVSSTNVINTENNQHDVANGTLYTAPSGARVFEAGTIQWSYGLDNYGGTTFVNSGIQRVTANILANFAT